MTDKTNFNRIMAGLEEVAEIVEGRAQPARVYVPEDIDVRSIRRRLNMSQNDFAASYGFGVAAVRDWEQHRRRPEAAARVLLTVIDKAPDVVTEALRLAALELGNSNCVYNETVSGKSAPITAKTKGERLTSAIKRAKELARQRSEDEERELVRTNVEFGPIPAEPGARLKKR